jgi:hypothetical protein
MWAGSTASLAIVVMKRKICASATNLIAIHFTDRYIFRSHDFRNLVEDWKGNGRSLQVLKCFWGKYVFSWLRGVQNGRLWYCCQWTFGFQRVIIFKTPENACCCLVQSNIYCHLVSKLAKLGSPGIHYVLTVPYFSTLSCCPIKICLNTCLSSVWVYLIISMKYSDFTTDIDQSTGKTWNKYRIW